MELNLKQEDFVDAIEEGKIVKVTEEYARLEGLPIIRRYSPVIQTDKKKKQEEIPYISLDDLRKPLKPKSQVLSELVENFQWQISKKRRELGITRRQLAQKISEPEYHIKMIENGILPKDDFVIINKIQSVMNINLRRDKKDFSQPARSLLQDKLEKEGVDKQEKKSPQEGSFLGSDIQIIDDE